MPSKTLFDVHSIEEGKHMKRGKKYQQIDGIVELDRDRGRKTY